MADAGSEQQLKALANLLLLQQRIREASTESEVGFLLVNDTRTLVDYRSAVLWLTSATRPGGGYIANVSGAIDHDDHAPYVQWMRALCRHLAQHYDKPEPCSWSKSDLPESLAGGWEAHGDKLLTWCPMYSASGYYLGALAFWSEKPLLHAQRRVLKFWLSAAGYSISALRGKAFARPRFVWTRKRKGIAAGVAVLLLLLMFLPVRLSVLAQAEIIARDPLVIRAPMDGIIDTIVVKPNAFVGAGDPLLTLDDTELLTRLKVAEQALAISRAQYQQAGQSASFDRDAKASLRVLALEGEKREAEVAYVKSLLERSTVEAEQAGVIIMPSPDELIGKPVVTGERLLTIASPAQSQLEAWLQVGDDIELPWDSEIVFFPNVAPDEKFTARLRRMDYRATTTEAGELAYRIRGEFLETEELPRIGMRGTAKLYGESVSLWYYLLRRPLAVVRRWVGV
ncbi:MAG: biotin/lipoyl-binding protein [Halieaceae bacterium]|nr:biotin/lipoyl-binding protein [Halieaceae bacterium]